MLDRSLTIPAKRRHASDQENCASPAKITTPRTRSKVLAETTPNASPSPSAELKLSRSKRTGLVTRTPFQTPIKPGDADSSKRGDNGTKRSNVMHTPVIPVTGTKRSNVMHTPVIPVTGTKINVMHTPVIPDIRVTRGRSTSKSPSTPVGLTRSGRSRSRTPVVNRKKSPGHAQTLITPNSRKKTPSSKHIPKEQATADDRPIETPSRKTKDSNKLDQTPQIPQSSRTTRSHTPVHTTPEESKTSRKISKPLCALECDTDSKKILDTSENKDNDNEVKINVTNQEKGNSCETENNETQSSFQCTAGLGKDLELCDRPSSVSDMEDVSSNLNFKNTEHTESSAPECTEEVQKEIAKVKRRRSTVGRGRSGQSLGGRRSLCPVLPILSLEDQICNIEKGLPQTSKVSHLLDISIREAMRRLETQCEANEDVAEMRHHLVTNAEKVAGHAAYKIAGLPLEVDNRVNQKINKDSSKSSNVVSSLKKRTKELEQEYKCWKTLLKERKLACQAAEREFREARSGETKIDEDNMKNLTTVQRNLLLSKPNYSDYIKEVQMAREKAFFVMKDVKHTTSVISNFITATKAVADSCYAAVEELTFGTVNNHSVKSSLKTLLTLEESSKETSMKYLCA